MDYSLKYGCVDITYKKLVSSIVLQSIEPLVSEVFQERGLGISKSQVFLHVLQRLSGKLDVLLGHTTCTLVEDHSGICCSICIDNIDFGQGCSFNVFSFLRDFLDRSHGFIRGFFLIGDLGGHNSSFVDIWEIDLDEHEATDIGMCLVQIFNESILHGLSDTISIFPVAWGFIVTSDVQDTISGNPGENLLIIILEHSVHAWEFVLSKNVLESKMQVQLKALLGSGGESGLLGSSIVRELN